MESKTFGLAMNLIKYVIGGIGAIACFWVLATSPGSDLTEIAKKEYADTTQMSLAIWYTLIAIISAVAGVVLFFIYQLITNTKKTAMSIIGVIAAALFFLILRLIGTSDTNESLQLAAEKHVDQGTLNFITAGLWTVLIGVAVGFLLAVLGPFILGKYRK